MRINIVLDDRLVTEAMRLTRARSKREVVHLALGVDRSPARARDPSDGRLARARRLRAYFRTLPFLLPRHPVETYAAAADLYMRCRKRGSTPRSPHDCLVACIAVEHATALLHDDRDYEALARVEPGLRFHLR